MNPALAPWIGILCGGLSGVILASIFGVLVLWLKTDQVVTGTGINLLAFGLVEVLYRRIFGATGDALKVAIVQPLHLPLLSSIPFLGPILFQQNLLVYITFLAVPAVYFYLFHTHHGLAIQACGEHPKAADTVGVSVLWLQAKCVLFGGFMAGACRWVSFFGGCAVLQHGDDCWSRLYRALRLSSLGSGTRSRRVAQRCCLGLPMPCPTVYRRSQISDLSPTNSS